MRGIHLRGRLADIGFVASGASLRQLRPVRFRRSRRRASADELTARIAQLVSERQQLRERGASEASLERNRIQLARAPWELGHALIDRHLPPAEPAHVAA
ncbi:MAG TPA: hypothetical protein VLD13_04125 [Gaiellaceae bacterium]|nr:hypothetical protein [Gaiellaceae bacterium]